MTYSNTSAEYSAIPSFSQHKISVFIEGIAGNISNIPINNVTSVNISMNYNADSFASISIEKSDFTGDIKVEGVDDPLHDTLLYTTFENANVRITIYSDPNIAFTGKVISISESDTVFTLNISNEFNNDVKAGIYKELDFIPIDELKDIFNIEPPFDNKTYAKYFDEACRYNMAYYILDNNGVITRKVLNREALVELLESLPKEPMPISIFRNVSLTKVNKSNNKIPNLYDVVCNVKFKRYNTLVKKISMSSSNLNLPMGLRSTFTTTNSDGSETTLYKTYDRPARYSTIVNALLEAGWKLSDSSTKTNYTSNILDLDGSVIYSPMQGDDITTCNVDAYRLHEQDVAIPYIFRIVNEDSIKRSQAIEYKRIDKEFIYSSNTPDNNNTAFSSYIDAYDWSNETHMRFINSLKRKTIFEMSSDNSIYLKNDVTASIEGISPRQIFTDGLDIISAPMYFGTFDEYGTKLITDGLHIASYGKCVILNHNVSWQSTGDLVSTYALKQLNVEMLSDTSLDMLELPPMPLIEPTSAPHDAPGSGLIQVNGSSADWENDLSWSFDNDVTLQRFYVYYYNPSNLAENSNPEVTETNYYLQSVYVNKKVDVSTLPFKSATSQCRIKKDKVKSIYTKAIILPPVVFEPEVFVND